MYSDSLQYDQNIYTDGLEKTLVLERIINSDNTSHKVDSHAEAKIIGITCGPVPNGHSRWTFRLLEYRARIELDISVNREAIHRALKNGLRPHLLEYWYIPNKEDPEFIPYIL